MTRLVLPLPPSANRMWRAVGGKVKVSEEGREYRDKAELALAMQRAEKLEGPVGLHIYVYFPNQRGDLDNRIKPLLDVLQGKTFKNDSQVHHLVVTRYIDKEKPRVEVECFAWGEDV